MIKDIEEKPFELGGGPASSKICVAYSSGNIEVWDLERSSRTGPRSAPYSIGGRRVGIDRTGSYAFSASFQDGISAFAAQDLSLIWTKPNVREIQVIASSARTDTLLIMTDSGKMYRVESRTGAVVDERKHVDRIFESPIDGTVLVSPKSRKEEYQVIGASSYSLRRASFAIIDVAFAPTAFIIREANGTLRSIDLFTGIQLAESTSVPPNPFRLHYSSQRRMFYAAYQTNGHKLIVSCMSTDLRMEKIGQIELPRSLTLCLCPARDSLVTSDGTEYDLATFQKIAILR